MEHCPFCGRRVSLILKGDEIRDFRDEDWIFIGVSRLPEEGKSGKVTVFKGEGHFTREFYPSVFNGHINNEGEFIIPWKERY